MEIYGALQGTTFKSPLERTIYRHLENVINKSKEPLSPEEKSRLDAMITSGSLFERDDSGGGGQDSGAPLVNCQQEACRYRPPIPVAATKFLAPMLATSQQKV